MQNDDTTIFNFGEKADEVMEELAAAGMHGMSTAQADLVVRMGRMLDFAGRKFSDLAESGKDVAELVNKAANHALAMRIHGATLRGSAGADMLEDLCDAAMGRYVKFEPVTAQKPVVKQPAIPKGCLTVEDAMRMLNCKTLVELADMIGSTAKTCSRWRGEGHMREKASATVRALYRGMQARAAA